jgi:hypothetical protein
MTHDRAIPRIESEPRGNAKSTSADLENGSSPAYFLTGGAATGVPAGNVWL